MNNYESLKQKTLDDMVEWLYDVGDFENAPWRKWWIANFCDKCETIKRNFSDNVEFCYCELNKNCRFFPEMEETPSYKESIRMWLEAEVENSYDA